MDKKKEYSKKWATLIKAVSFLPADLPSITAYLDTGYGKDETIRILRRMWKGKLKWSFDDTYFGVYLFRWEEVDADEKYVDGICDGDVKFSSIWIRGTGRMKRYVF